MSQKNALLVVFGVILFIFVGGFFLTQSKDTTELVEDSKAEYELENKTRENEETVDQNTRPQAKIDVKVACESALMYTTFIDGAAADAYVAECVEGKHPEVIDRYIESLNLSEGVTI